MNKFLPLQFILMCVLVADNESLRSKSIWILIVKENYNLITTVISLSLSKEFQVFKTNKI